MPEHLPPTAPTSSLPSNHLAPSNLDAQIQTLLTHWTEQKLAQSNKAQQLYDQLLELVEPPLLRAVVESQSGQLLASARILGLHRTTLKKKMDPLDEQ